MQYFQQLTESDILKKRADINRVLNEIKNPRNLKTLLENTCRTI